MLFNSIEFLFFFIVVTTAFFLIPHKFRWFLLLAASSYFYMFFKPVYILILAFTIFIDYFAGILIENEHDKKRKKIFLIASIVSNIGVLAIFKYYNFFNENLTVLANSLGVENKFPVLEILLPIGLSFHTFQAMSYTFEVYYGRQKAEKHLGIYALYVMFYPQLVAGPIERPQHILPQLHQKKYFTYENAIAGLNLIALGLFKKIVVADRLAIYVNSFYNDVEGANSISAFFAICFFSIQIYCDFSGYSDIARGTARFMGYDLMVNFKNPYSAQSISDFWNRWHISLSTWFRDYLYIPLGGSWVPKWKWIRNLTIVFLLSGLWHGANWTFIVWGALHAAYLIFAIVTKDIRNKIIPSLGIFTKYVNQVIVFALVTFAWIFFRAENFEKANLVISKLLSFDFSINSSKIFAHQGSLNMALTFMSLLLWIIIPLPKQKAKPIWNVLFLALITILIITLGKNGSEEFIYFQF
jgi:alginate O-acetyltransferase complex protein AlgI